MASESPYAVFLYYPNLIGYSRIAAVLASYYVAGTNWKLSVCFYVLAFAGDVVDGAVARRFNQSSSFGATLDMVTDRCSTAGMLFVLAGLYPAYAFHFMCLMFLDIFSHWIHVASVATKGHHKAAGTLHGRNWLIRLFYGCYPFFGYCCVFTEFFYICLYMLAFNKDAFVTVGGVEVHLWQLTFYGCLPACVCKQAVNVAQLCAAAYSMAEVDVARKAKA
eukprot:TRINITY_DN192_c0_g1_i1.p3 TRINITY_DN192_c0_g1~~TRINITY_DN192_c0_g1_i1.p3  ORF type:complete len:220 (-),score=63.92 TRINITY_DN192_c0_g1_i1:1607-2266(-)